MVKTGLTRAAVVVAALLVLGLPAMGIPLDDQARTLLVRPHYTNQLPGPEPEGALGASTYGGHVGPYAAPSGTDEPATPAGGAYALTKSSFGQPCAPYVAYDNFDEVTVDTVRPMLFQQEGLGGIGTLHDWTLEIVSHHMAKSATFSPEGSTKGSIDVEPLRYDVPESAGTVTFDVDVDEDDSWEAEIVYGDFVTFPGGASTLSGQGDASVAISYEANAGSGRSAQLMFEDTAKSVSSYVYVDQDGARDSMTVSPGGVQSVPETAGSLTFDIDMRPNDRPWEATIEPGSTSSFLTFDDNVLHLEESGDLSLEVHYEANPGGVRSQLILFESSEAVNSPLYILVVQGAAQNILSISPQSQIVSPDGSSVTINVGNEGNGTMEWNASVSTGGDFLSLDPATPTGEDTGSFIATIAPNLGAPRMGTIFVNAAGAEGSPATFTVFQQGATTYSGEGNKAIPNPGTITSAAIVDDYLTVAEVKVHLHISHTWDEDLHVVLRSPSGTEVTLFSGVGEGGDDFGSDAVPLTLAAYATKPISQGAAPFAGTYQPQGDLTRFVGEEAFGSWTLVIEDQTNPSATTDEAAFRFIDELYTSEGGTAVSRLENRLLTEQEVDQMLEEMYGDDEIALIAEAEAMVRDALRYAPFDEDLRNALLDIFYYRCVANTLFAKEKLVRAYKTAIDVPVPGERIIDSEIEDFTDALDAYRSAADPYYELFTDGMGVNVAEVAQAEKGGPKLAYYPPFGYYVFREEVPVRSLYAATFRDENDDPTSVVGEGKSSTEPLLNGYKDWALLFELLRDRAEVARELALRLVMRGNPQDGLELSDVDQALELVDDELNDLDFAGTILLGIFGDYDPANIGESSGVPEAIASYQTAMAELEGFRQFILGELNLLGFREDFLMLVQKYGDVSDSFDALIAWNDSTDPSTPLGSAIDKLDEARTSYENYRGQQDDLAVQFSRQVLSYRDRLSDITGIDPGADPANPVDAAYFTPAENVGSEINVQTTSIELAINRIRQNRQEIANLKEQIEIEVQRRAQEAQINATIQNIRVQYGAKQAELTKEIAQIEAEQVRADNLCDAANCVSAQYSFGPTGGWSVSVSGGLVAYTANAFVQYEWEQEKGELSAQKESLAAMEEAEVAAQDDALLDVNSKANIKTWLLGMKTLQIQSQEACLMLNQEVARLIGLYGEKVQLESRMAEASNELLNRYFADPTHRLRYTGDMLDAQKAFEQAQKWVYFTLRAFEYKHNIPGFVSTNGYSLNSVFGARNAEELLDIVTDIKAYDVELSSLPSGEAKEDWLSFTEDILGFRKVDDQGNTILYTDPFSGEPGVTACEILQNYLLLHMDEEGVISLPFSTVRDNGISFFRGPKYLADGSLASPGSFLDKINAMKINIVGSHTVPNVEVAGYLLQGGTQYIRDIDVGTSTDPERPDLISGEMTAWTTRFWYKHPGDSSATPPIRPGWRFSEGLSAEVVLNLTNESRDTTTGHAFSEFSERSVAADGWRLLIVSQDTQGSLVRVSEIDDIEFYFNHRAKNRPAKAKVLARK